MWADLFALLAILIIIIRAIMWEDKNLRWVWFNLLSLVFMVVAFYSAVFIEPITVTNIGTVGSTAVNITSTMTQTYVAVNSEQFIFYVSILVFWTLLCMVLMVKDFLEVRNIASMRRGVIDGY